MINLSVIQYSLQMSVEVERKFMCGAHTLKALEEIGGKYSIHHKALCVLTDN